MPACSLRIYYSTEGTYWFSCSDEDKYGSMILTLSIWEMRATCTLNCSLEYSYSRSFIPPPSLSPLLSLPFLSSSLRLRQLCSLTLDVIIFVLVSYCWHFNSGAPQSGLTQTARNHTSQPFLTAALVASNFSQIKGLFYLVVFFTRALYCEKTNQTASLWFAGW